MSVSGGGRQSVESDRYMGEGAVGMMVVVEGMAGDAGEREMEMSAG